MKHKERLDLIPRLMNKLRSGKITKRENKELAKAMTQEVMLRIARKRRGV